MAEQQFSIRSSKAFKLAHLFAKKERRSVAQVVERALELYACAEPTRETAPDFYARISREYGTDVDLDALIRLDRKVDREIDL